MVRNGGVLGTCSPVANVRPGIAESSRVIPPRVNRLIADGPVGLIGAR